MEEKEILYRGYLDQMTATATAMYSDFDKAFGILQKEPEKAVTLFKEIYNKGMMQLDALDYYFKDFFDIANDELFLRIGMVTSLVIKSSHNLRILYKHFKDEKKETYWQGRNSYYKAVFFYYYHLLYYGKHDEKLYPIYEVYYKDANIDLLEEAMGDLLLFDYSIKNNLVEEYFENDKTGYYRHWFSRFFEMEKLNITALNVASKNVAIYLLSHFKEIRIKRFIYNSIFYQSICLDYAYKTDDIYAVDAILDNGFDRYRELETLAIILRNDHERFKNDFLELKAICLKRLMDKCDTNKGNYYFVDVYGKDVLDTVYRYAYSALQIIDKFDGTDPRNDDARHEPEWAKLDS